MLSFYPSFSYLANDYYCIVLPRLIFQPAQRLAHYFTLNQSAFNPSIYPLMWDAPFKMLDLS